MYRATLVVSPVLVVGGSTLSNRTRRPAPEPVTSDYGPVIVDPNTGEFRYARAIEIEEVAHGTVGTVRRARLPDPLVRIGAVTTGMRLAASIYRQAVEHVGAGRGMGPLPWAADRVQEHRSSEGPALLPQERAASAARWHRRGRHVMGWEATKGVVQWVVIAGLAPVDYDADRRWRKGRASKQLVAALGRLAVEYGCE